MRLISLLLLALALLTAIRPVWTIDPDAAAYVGLGRSLAAGDGYVLAGLPHGKYPPGQPLLLAGLMRLAGPDAYGVFHGALVLAALAAVVLSHALVRRLGFGPGPALTVAACVGLSQPLFDLSVRYLRTEPLFMALTLGALLALLRSQERDGRWRDAVAAALLTVAAMATRMAGVTLLVLPAWQLLRPRAGASGRARAGLVVLAGAALLLAWVGRGHALRTEHPEAPDYSQELLAAEPRDLTKVVRDDMPLLDARSLARRVAGNVAVLARASAVLLTNVDKASRHLPVGLVTLAVLLVGLAAATRPRPSANPGSDATLARAPPSDTDPEAGSLSARRGAVLYVVATLGLYLLWPFNQQERFYVPLLPLLLLFAGLGVGALWDALAAIAPRPGARRAVLGLAVIVWLFLAAQQSDDPRLLGRWSMAYGALLAAGLAVLVVLTVLLQRGRLPPLPPRLALAAPVLFALPFADVRFREWPATVRTWEEREHALDRIDVHPVLEQVAVFLRDETPPDTVVMTDVPKMLSLMSGRRCVPFVYRLEPPAVLLGEADLLFYTREIPEAAAVLDAVSGDYESVLELPGVDDGTRLVLPEVLRPAAR